MVDPIEEAVDRLRTNLSADIESAVAEGVRKATTPPYLKTADACSATGLSKRSLRHLRDSGKVSFHKVGSSLVYDSAQLFREIDARNIPAKINGTT